ncbi:hypothetical protein ON010_g8119 [Phytophthora cinnamomi]|nr:hypothetical protein ON010_g8119 [Phytophthora cinnamomi]
MSIHHITPPLSPITYEEEGHDGTRQHQDARVRQHHLRHRVECEAHAGEARDAAVEQHLAVLLGDVETDPRHLHHDLGSAFTTPLDQPSRGRAGHRKLT